jgi:hypothetical protein
MRGRFGVPGIKTDIDEISKRDFIYAIDDVGNNIALALDCANYWGSALIITTTAACLNLTLKYGKSSRRCEGGKIADSKHRVVLSDHYAARSCFIVSAYWQREQ